MCGLPIDEIVNQLLDGVIARVRQRVPWRPGARDLLAELRVERIPCALVTMSWRRLADAIVAELPPGSFAATIVGDEVRRGKPHPEPYLAAARALSVSPRDCVALEDSPTGVRSATAAGCHVIAIPHIVDVPEGRGHRAGRLAGRPARRQPARATHTPAQPGPVGCGARVGPGRRGHRRCHAQRRTAATPTDRHPDRCVGAVLGPARRATIIGDPRPNAASGLAVLVLGSRRHDHHRRRQSGSRNHSRLRVGGPLGRGQARAVDRRRDARRRHGGDPGRPERSFHACRRNRRPGRDQRLRRHRHRLRAVRLRRQQGARGRRPVRCGSTSSPSSANACMRMVARSRSACRTSTMAGAPTPAATGCTTTRAWPRMSTRSGSWPTTTRPGRAGPIAPLAFVRQAISAAKNAVDDDSKLVLGIALYGYNWPIATVGTCPGRPRGKDRRQPTEHRRTARQADGNAGV